LKQFISVADLRSSQDETLSVAIERQAEKALQYKVSPHKDLSLGKGKRIGLVFLNPSLRTRLSTQIAAENLGMCAVVFNTGSEGWSWEFEDGVVMNGATVEHIKDAAPVLGSYFDILALRTFPSLQNKEADYSEYALKQFIRYAGVPVVSLESATLHPLQSLADIITIKENHFNQHKPKVVLSWAPHIKALPQCVSNSFAQWMKAWGQCDFVITHPEGYQLDESFTEGAVIMTDQQKALEGADYVYVKNWSSYRDYGKVLSKDQSWMLTNQKLAVCPSAKIMHCLPVRRNVELSDEVLDSQYSLVTQQAANRLWATQSILSSILSSNG